MVKDILKGFTIQSDLNQRCIKLCITADDQFTYILMVIVKLFQRTRSFCHAFIMGLYSMF